MDASVVPTAPRKRGVQHTHGRAIRRMDLGGDATYHQIESRRFDFLLSLVNEDITGQPGFRLKVPADMKLVVTLRKLFR